MPPPTELGSTATMENVTGQFFHWMLSNLAALKCRMAKRMENIQRNVQSTSRNELVLDSLASNITEFAYDLQQGNTFDGWFSRYVDLFEKDASKLDDAAKVRLLLRKLNPAAHERYTSFILPKQSKEFSFEETVSKLQSIFGSPVSQFHRRYQCMQTEKEENEDLISYSCKVNRACVDFKLQELKEDQFKSLIFVCGLKSAKDADIRMRLLSKINETQDITLEKVVEEYKSLINLKKDTVLIGGQASTSVSAVRANPSKDTMETILMLLSNCLDTIDENAAKQIQDALREMKIIVNIKSFQDVQDVQDIQLEPNTACVFLCSNLVFNDTKKREYLEELVKHAASLNDVVVFLIEKTLYTKDGIKKALSKNPTLDDKNIVVIKDYLWEETGLDSRQGHKIAKRILDEVKAKEEQLARLT